MPVDVENAKVLAFLVRLQLLKRHNKGVLQQVTKMRNHNLNICRFQNEFRTLTCIPCHVKQSQPGRRCQKQTADIGDGRPHFAQHCDGGAWSDRV